MLEWRLTYIAQRMDDSHNFLFHCFRFLFLKMRRQLASYNCGECHCRQLAHFFFDIFFTFDFQYFDLRMSRRKSKFYAGTQYLIERK